MEIKEKSTVEVRINVNPSGLGETKANFPSTSEKGDGGKKSLFLKWKDKLTCASVRAITNKVIPFITLSEIDNKESFRN